MYALCQLWYLIASYSVNCNFVLAHLIQWAFDINGRLCCCTFCFIIDFFTFYSSCAKLFNQIYQTWQEWSFRKKSDLNVNLQAFSSEPAIVMLCYINWIWKLHLYKQRSQTLKDLKSKIWKIKKQYSKEPAM